MKRMLLVAALAAASAAALAAAPRQEIVEDYALEAGVAAFSAQRGRAFFEATHRGGKAETPSCTSCHGINPQKSGQTPDGESIAAMAVSANPERFTDRAFVERWFRHDCRSVVGRECTAAEKGDVITYLSGL